MTTGPDLYHRNGCTWNGYEWVPDAYVSPSMPPPVAGTAMPPPATRNDGGDGLGVVPGARHGSPGGGLSKVPTWAYVVLGGVGCLLLAGIAAVALHFAGSAQTTTVTGTFELWDSSTASNGCVGMAATPTSGLAPPSSCPTSPARS